MKKETMVVYASLTGDAEKVARKTVEILGNPSLGPVEFSEITPKDLEEARELMLVVSTYNWGEPPGNTYQWFGQNIWKNVYHTEVWEWRKLNLKNLRFSMVALGDKSYAEEYCLFGKNLAWWLEACGAKQIGDLVMVDCNNEADINRWLEIARQHGAILGL